MNNNSSSSTTTTTHTNTNRTSPQKICQITSLRSTKRQVATPLLPGLAPAARRLAGARHLSGGAGGAAGGLGPGALQRPAAAQARCVWGSLVGLGSKDVVKNNEA